MGCFDCYSDCTGGCMTGCSSTCSGSCSGGCSGTCTGSCTDTCKGSCVSTCGRACSTSCSSACTGGCTGTCSGSCTGGCSGTCTGSCTDTCKGSCVSTCGRACSTSCSSACTGGCAGTCSGTCTGGCGGTCSSSCGSACSTSCSSACTGGCTGTCSGTCSGGCTGTCSNACGAACTSTCSGGCSGTCSGSCTDTCAITCSTTCSNDCTGGCNGTCTGICLATCTANCAADCQNSCSGTSSGVVVNPLGPPNINSVPNSMLLGGSFTFSGTWTNAHHTATSIDGTDWEETTGESFSRVITLNTLGQHTVLVAARNTANEDDYGSDNDTRSYTVNVVTVSLPALLGNLSMSESVPTEVFIDESFTISGTWPNAHHTAISIDGSAWDESLGESFSRTITINTLGHHTVSISARNTAGTEDPGTDNDTSNFIVNVVESLSGPKPLGNIIMTQRVPDFTGKNESFVISGSCENAHHMTVKVDGESESVYYTDSFTKALSIGKVGINDVKVSARNTPNASDEGSEYKEEIYKVYVGENLIRIVELSSNIVIVELDSYYESHLKMLDVSTGDELYFNPATKNATYNSDETGTTLDADKLYRWILYDGDGAEKAREDFVIGVDNIVVTSISTDGLTIQQQ